MMTIDQMIAVLTAAKNGAEIECCPIGRSDWFDNPWGWDFIHFRYRVKPPAKKIVKSLAWRHRYTGGLAYGEPTLKRDANWQRFPCADFEGEVE